MAYLDDLLTLNGSLKDGFKIYPDKLPPKNKSLWEYLLPRNFTDVTYKVHYTKAGLPLVLPHDYKGNIKLAKNSDENFTESRSWFNFPVINNNGFRLVELIEKKKAGKTSFNSTVMKSGYDHQLNFGIEIYVKHSILEDGKIIHLVLQNHIFPEKSEPAVVEYEVLNHPSGEVVAGYSESSYRTRRIPIGMAINPEKTIPNLLGMISDKEIPGMNLFKMFTLSYEVLKPVH